MIAKTTERCKWQLSCPRPPAFSPDRGRIPLPGNHLESGTRWPERHTGQGPTGTRPLAEAISTILGTKAVFPMIRETTAGGAER